MTDKEFKSTCRTIDRFIKIWTFRLNLGHWRIQANKTRDYHPNERERFADCDPAWEYMQMCLNFYVAAIWECMDEADIEEVVVHELTHGVVNELTTIYPEDARRGLEEEASRHEERVVTHLTKALLASYNEGLKKGK